MNSRAYVFIFALKTADDVPEDFRPSLEGRTFKRGIFLPQADTKWFTDTPEYPARLLFLSGDQLSIVPHPSACQPTVEVALKKLLAMETGNNLLSGWIQFVTQEETHRLPYNTRVSTPVDDFASAVRRKWLGDVNRTEASKPKLFGHELDIKFKNLLDDSLDPDEVVRIQYFTPPVKYEGRRLTWRRIKRTPGHLIALTSGNRMLWLHDEHRGRCERYAGIAASAPAGNLTSANVEKISTHHDLVVTFKPGMSWRVYIGEPERDTCVAFSECLNANLTWQASTFDSNDCYSRR